jgi:hypothetical protein
VSWQEVAREEDNERLNGSRFTGTFAVADRGECRFIRLVNIGRNHLGNNCLQIYAWEIFGTLIDSADAPVRGVGGPVDGPKPSSTLAPSPPPGGVRLLTMMEIHANSMIPSCRRLQLSLGSCGVTSSIGRSVPMFPRFVDDLPRTSAQRHV